MLREVNLCLRSASDDLTRCSMEVNVLRRCGRRQWAAGGPRIVTILTQQERCSPRCSGPPQAPRNVVLLAISAAVECLLEFASPPCQRSIACASNYTCTHRRHANTRSVSTHIYQISGALPGLQPDEPLQQLSCEFCPSILAI